MICIFNDRVTQLYINNLKISKFQIIKRNKKYSEKSTFEEKKINKYIITTITTTKIIYIVRIILHHKYSNSEMNNDYITLKLIFK